MDVGELREAIDASRGGTLEPTVTNWGETQHTLTLGDKGTKFLNKGERETITFGPIAAAVQLLLQRARSSRSRNGA